MRLGVVIGRFQVDEPHEGHNFLLDHAERNSDRLLIVLGTGPLPTTARKPLPFKTRRAILQSFYPDAIIRELHDHHDDAVWSRELDYLINQVQQEIRPYREMVLTSGVLKHDEDTVTLFHSRDSFREYYSGTKTNIVEVPEADIGMSGTLHRARLARTPLGSRDFARGVIWANENKFPTVYSAVDGAILRFRNCQYIENQILLITKKGRKGWLFPGGFAEPMNDSDEEDVAREVHEECGILLAPDPPLCYVGSKKVEDWRYEGEPDIIRSRMYLGYADNPTTTIVAGDDADTARWVPTVDLLARHFNKCHIPLYQQLLKHVLEGDK